MNLSTDSRVILAPSDIREPSSSFTFDIAKAAPAMSIMASGFQGLFVPPSLATSSWINLLSAPKDIVAL
jgi:hypothetical protein